MYKISPTIDSKVCNKKVAVDDVGPAVARRGDMAHEEEVPVAKHEPWSCVDYVDTIHRSGREPTKPSRATKPASGDGLRVRFGDVDGAEERAKDGAGRCQERVSTGGMGDCGTVNEMVFGDEATVEEHKWYTEKQTNRGWPGTASGNTETADGMADDLSKTLDRSQRNSVASLLSKTISGAEVVERS